MKVYVLQALGFGDDEHAFYNVGVYSSKNALEDAERKLKSDSLADGFEAETMVEEYELDA